ncbi:MAG: NYN domain-containing protein [Bacteroidota bacterium]|nr:NYN domain-containing protein [Bacteroidota bacterium]
MKNRLIVFIDGFNLYHALDNNPLYWKYKWLDFSHLIKIVTPKTYNIQDILYFTSLMKWLPEKMARHQLFIKAVELKGVKTIYGEFKLRDRLCPKCGNEYQGHEEKQTDVNIAIQLFKLAVEDKYDVALIVSGDSDLIPSLKAVKATFPAKRIGVAIPIGRRADDLKNCADFYMKLKEKHFRESQFPNEIDIGDGQKLKRPAHWV